MERERIKEVIRRLDRSMRLRGKLKRNEARKRKMSSKQLVVFLVEDLTGGILSGSLCCTSCVPEGKHVGQKDDTRENSCVTESEKEIGERIKERGERWRERERKRRYDSVTTSQKAKSHTISILYFA